MATSIEILASADHGNVDFAFADKSVTPLPVGFSGGGILLKDQKKSSAVDVSAHGNLRLDLDVTAMSNRHGFENGLPGAALLYVALEHSPDGVQGWRLLHQFEPMNDLGKQRVTLGAFDKFVRASWYFLRTPASATYTEQVAFTFSLTGEGIPEAAA